MTMCFSSGPLSLSAASPMQLKPMNCPFHIGVYKQGYFSYRDLPIRWAELGTGGARHTGTTSGCSNRKWCREQPCTMSAFLLSKRSPRLSVPGCVLLPAVYRYERSGTMHGLFRVRGFTQASCACCTAWCGTWGLPGCHVLASTSPTLPAA